MFTYDILYKKKRNILKKIFKNKALEKEIWFVLFISRYYYGVWADCIPLLHVSSSIYSMCEYVCLRY